MPASALRILHAIHDFLPRYRAGSELYAAALCRELQRDHQVTVLAAEYDPARRHGELSRREVDGLPVVELVNNWSFESFAESYASPDLRGSLERVLDETMPDVVHLHSLFNLSFELPRLARRRGAAVVATLHDYTLLCPSGGQRIHRAENHVCHEIDTTRCARCFKQSPYYSKMAFGSTALAGAGAASLGRLARLGRRLAPRAAQRANSAFGRLGGVPIEAVDIERRLAAALALATDIDLFVAPSASLAREFERFGFPADRIEVRDYGFPPLARRAAVGSPESLRLGFVGSLVWHKGAHVLIDAVRRLPPGGWSLTIHGDAGVDPPYAAALRKSARGMPVRFAGRFDSAQAAEVYAELDLLVVPSLWLENSPLVIHEAFQAGVPVVGSRIGGIADLVRDGVDGRLVAAGSAQALAEALEELLFHRHRVRGWAAAVPGVETIEEDARLWEKSYRRVAATRSVGTSERNLGSSGAPTTGPA